MLSAPLVAGASFAYLMLLFGIAHWGDRRAAQGRSVIGNPWVYALSLGVYCTAWTYFGSIGRAASAGVWFLPIYLGPTLAMVLAWIFLHELAVTKRLLEQTAPPNDKLLAFWAPIGTTGKNSLYTRLFLNHNMLSLDSAFKENAAGDYLTGKAKLADHLPVLMAAFKLMADDITAIAGVNASLTLENVSLIYRHGLLARLLGIRVRDLLDVIQAMGSSHSPFADAESTLAILELHKELDACGLSFRQFVYVVKDLDDPLKPLAPGLLFRLKTAKTLYDGLKAIEQDHPVQLEYFNMKIIYDRQKTGFEATHDFPIRIGDVIAGRYEIVESLGSAAFSRAVKCIDHLRGHAVCLKIIKNNKDYFDQSLDEIKLLTLIKHQCASRCDDFHVLELFDYFYFKEHLFLVCELLRENLYEVYKYNRQSGETIYFNIPRLQRVAWQSLLALHFIHSKNLIHCDLKPENIRCRFPKEEYCLMS